MGEEGKNPPLMTDALKLLLVLRIRLDPQTGRENELSNRGAEAGEEGIERLSEVSPTRISFPFSFNPTTRSSCRLG